MKRAWLAVAGVILLAFAGSAPASAQEKVLRVRIGSDMTGLDPAKLSARRDVARAAHALERRLE